MVAFHRLSKAYHGWKRKRLSLSKHNLPMTQRKFNVSRVNISWFNPQHREPSPLLFQHIFSIHYFFAEGKKVKGMVRNDVFGGWDR